MNSNATRTRAADLLSAPDSVEITLVVPVFEEQENIVPFITEVKKHVQLPHCICIIFDHSTDGTLLKRDEVHSIDPTVQFIQNAYGKGIINAFKTGFEVSRTRYIVAIMADLSDTPETILRMYNKIEEGYDLVVASRYCQGGRKIGGPRLKYWLSRLANTSLFHLSGIPTHDMTNAFIIHKRDILSQIHLRSTGGFEITMEIIAKSFILGAKIAEVPTVNKDRNAGSSKFRLLSWVGKYFYWYIYILTFSMVNRLNARYVADTRKSSVDE
ncbi:glycosyltransferase [Tardiphaga sp. 803_E3_N1_3]|uniref:glycosyltransferase n=1 Tax=Tardiphaga sp. 803_E3_N1_3 TaxID=3240785 RepID=UPI003F222704